MRNEITLFAKSLSRRFDRNLNRECQFSTQPNEKSKKFTRGIFLVIYHPLLGKLNNAMDKKMYLFYMKEAIKKLRLEILFSSSRNPVRVKFYPLIMVVRSCRCDSKRCQLCSNISETDEFVCSVNHKIYRMNHKLDCDEKLCYA